MYYDKPRRVAQELARRRKDKGIRAAVLEYLGELPEGWPQDQPVATINRYVATARIEDVVFAHAAISLGLRPFWPTYLGEKYTDTNPEKVSVLRPRIQRPKMQLTNQWLVARPQRCNERSFASITASGVPVASIHQQAREAVLGLELSGNVFDITQWNREQARRFGFNGNRQITTSPDYAEWRLAPFYYHGVMALYICHGVLFEDWDGGPNADNDLDGFVSEVVLPAYQSVSKIFGLEPLMVRLPYSPGFLDFPGVTATIFDRFREE